MWRLWILSFTVMSENLVRCNWAFRYDCHCFYSVFKFIMTEIFSSISNCSELFLIQLSHLCYSFANKENLNIRCILFIPPNNGLIRNIKYKYQFFHSWKKRLFSLKYMYHYFLSRNFIFLSVFNFRFLWEIYLKYTFFFKYMCTDKNLFYFQ